jgi:hypothetical protein
LVSSARPAAETGLDEREIGSGPWADWVMPPGMIVAVGGSRAKRPAMGKRPLKAITKGNGSRLEMAV